MMLGVGVSPRCEWEKCEPQSGGKVATQRLKARTTYERTKDFFSKL